MRPAVKRPIGSAAPDVGIEIPAHRCGAQELVHSDRSDLAVMIVGAFEQDDHVMLSRVIADPLYEATAVSGSTCKAVEGDGAAVLDCHGFSAAHRPATRSNRENMK